MKSSFFLLALAAVFVAASPIVEQPDADVDFDSLDSFGSDDAFDVAVHELEARKVTHKKVGISADWNTPKQGAAVAHLKNNHTSAHYNWSPWKFDNLPKGISFWPMLHGEESIKDWGHVTKGYGITAMGCNEVNHAGQSKMTVKRGVEIWKKYLMPLKNKGYKLVSHSTDQSASGTAWQKAWRKACPACHKSVWAYSVHWYGTDPAAFKKYVTNMHKITGKPIVVTEFACTDFSGQKKCDAAKAKAFMDNVTSWMNAQDWIPAYFWFGAWPAGSMPGGVQGANSIVDGNGNPTALGKHYMQR
ncbi:hypothetical protein EXIGLDRAFT_725098 [Exidia glandulosa HHB12029]|uniref:Asl1-like glycosyl hydrolase catalytic domain-containing protein n=1 Tax=Exidia glandulosa HHB12029 TaxID=1314781 RepID=A0A165E680_EXIGL|nr:hypothetical protein EXIGLDRAFT_725098 [Exidia glandulosa HHB12029]